MTVLTFSDDITSFGHLLLVHGLNKFSDLQQVEISFTFQRKFRRENVLFVSQKHNLQLVWLLNNSCGFELTANSRENPTQTPVACLAAQNLT